MQSTSCTSGWTSCTLHRVGTPRDIVVEEPTPLIFIHFSCNRDLWDSHATSGNLFLLPASFLHLRIIWVVLCSAVFGVCWLYSLVTIRQGPSSRSVLVLHVVGQAAYQVITSGRPALI